MSREQQQKLLQFLQTQLAAESEPELATKITDMEMKATATATDVAVADVNVVQAPNPIAGPPTAISSLSLPPPPAAPASAAAATSSAVVSALGPIGMALGSSRRTPADAMKEGIRRWRAAAAC